MGVLNAAGWHLGRNDGKSSRKMVKWVQNAQYSGYENGDKSRRTSAAVVEAMGATKVGLWLVMLESKKNSSWLLFARPSRP